MKVGMRIACLIIALVCFATIELPFKSNAAPSLKREEKKFIEWTLVRKYSDLPTDTNHNYYMYIVWDSNNGNPNDLTNSSSSACCITHKTGRCDDYDEYLQGAYFSSSDYSKVFFVSKDKFITTSPYGMPKITYAGTDGDNGDVPKYYIRLNAGSGKYVNRDDDEFDFKDSGCAWGVAVNGGGKTKYEKSAEHNGCVCFFYNEKGGGIDEGFLFHGDKIEGYEDKDYDDFDPFKMWIGREVIYSVVTENYNVMPGQVLSIKDRVVIDNDVTVTVYPGGILSVDGTLINNGTVKNYGTVIIEKENEMFPIVMGTQKVEDAGTIDPNSNTIYCYGSSYSITPPGYNKKMVSEGILINRGNLAFGNGMGGLYLDAGATFENEGFLLTTDSFRINNSVFVNSGSAAIGYEIKNVSEVFGYKSAGYPKVYTITISKIKITYAGWGLVGLSYSNITKSQFNIQNGSVCKNKGIAYVCGDKCTDFSSWGG